MATSDILSLKHFLLSKQYPEDGIQLRQYYYEKQYQKIEIWRKGYCIQAFVILSKEEKETKLSFPFYRKYDQVTPSGEPIKPYCLVAVLYGDDDWRFFSPSDCNDQRETDYDDAVQSFQKRLNQLKGTILSKRVKRMSYTLVVVIVLYMLFHLLSTNGVIGIKLPMTTEIVTLGILLTILAVVPLFVPYINSMSVANLQIKLRKENQRDTK